MGNSKNQVHRPAPKKVRVDSLGNDKRKLWLRDGNTTMLLTQGLTENACKVVIDTLNDTLIKLGKKSIKKRFLITR